MSLEKSILVTGGAGFIGSGVIRLLNESGYYRIIVVDNLGSSFKWRNLVGKRFLEIIHKDHLFDWLQGKEKQIGAIIHLGACSSTVETDANYLLANNTRYTMRLAELALSKQIRFIYASSASTYGDGAHGFSDRHSELEKFSPLNMYGYSKHLVDLWLKEQNALDSVVALKYFNVFGPNEYHKGRMSSAVLKMTQEAKTTGQLHLFKSSEPERFKDGEQVRDFIYVKDAAAMTVQFLHNSHCGIFNIGTGVEQTWNELAKGVMEALEQPASLVYKEMPEDLKGIYQNYTLASMDKYKKAELLMPRFSLKAAVKDYVTNYLLQNRYW